MGQENGEGAAKGAHVYMIPFPGQGHINPLLAFAKCIASKGVHISFILTTQMIKSSTISHLTSSITLHAISDGSEYVQAPETVETYFNRMHTALSQNLSKFLDEHITSSGCSHKLIIYDSVLPWVLEVAHQRGLLGAPFFTQSCSVSAVFYHVKTGSLPKFPTEEDSMSLPCLPTLKLNDLPSYAGLASDHIVVDFLAQQFSNVDKADWIFINTFYHLENQILDWMESHCPIKAVGPTFLLGRHKDEDNTSHPICIYEPKHDACREWLDSRQTGSVVYVSFGSVATLGKEQMEELAFGLTMSNCHFLWVVRSTEVDKLPQDFTSLASQKGLMIEWCHQTQVLAHPALACFMSHCGWNSTLEALSYGVPIIAMGQWYDQITNSKMVEEVWRFGVRVKRGGNAIVSGEEIAKCIKEVVHGDMGAELKEEANKWKELAKEAVEEGGTSANNIQDFVSKLMCC